MCRLQQPVTVPMHTPCVCVVSEWYSLPKLDAKIYAPSAGFTICCWCCIVNQQYIQGLQVLLWLHTIAACEVTQNRLHDLTLCCVSAGCQVHIGRSSKISSSMSEVDSRMLVGMSSVLRPGVAFQSSIPGTFIPCLHILVLNGHTVFIVT